MRAPPNSDYSTEITEEMIEAAYRVAVEWGMLWNEAYDNEAVWQESPVWRRMLEAALALQPKACCRTDSGRTKSRATLAPKREVARRRFPSI